MYIYFFVYLFSRNGVGTTGALQTMYFAEVTDSMRVSKGEIVLILFSYGAMNALGNV
jgi:hypothetical protein